MIRPATNNDSSEIRKLVFEVLREYKLSPDPESTDADLNDIEASYFARGGCFDVFEEANGEIIGTVGLFPMDSQTCELRKMYLASDHRGKGIGKKLLEHSFERAKALGFTRISLETAFVLKEAIALYEKYGFEPCPADHLSERSDQAYSKDLTVPHRSDV